MKLQLKVFSGSWWATRNRKQTQKRRGQPEGIVPSYKNNKTAVTLQPATESEKMRALWRSGCFTGMICNVDPTVLIHFVAAGRVSCS